MAGGSPEAPVILNPSEKAVPQSVLNGGMSTEESPHQTVLFSSEELGPEVSVEPEVTASRQVTGFELSHRWTQQRHRPR